MMMLAAILSCASSAWAESITPPAAINLNADTNRAASTGTGAGDVSVAFGNTFISDGPVQYSTGVGSDIILTAAAGFQFDPASPVSMTCAAYDINGNGVGNPAVVVPTGAAAESLIFNLTSGGTAAADVFLITGISVRIISPAGASAGAHDTFLINTTAVGGAINNTPTGVANVSAGSVAHHLAFTVEPMSTVAGMDLTPVVQIQDFGNNVVTGADRLISLAIQNNPGAATLHGDRHHLSNNGIATWTGADDLRINNAANGYTLVASHSGSALAGGVDTVNSGAFNIAPDAADHLIFSAQPNSPIAGADILTAVTAFDQFNNPVPGVGITLSPGSNPTGATLFVGSSLMKNTDASGIATWGPADDLHLNIAGTGYRLQAAGAGAPVLSNAFNVTAAGNSALRFVQQPSNTDVSAVITPNVSVEVIDPFGNRTGAALPITLSLAPNPCAGSPSGNVANSVAGLATFPTLSVNTVCTGYQLHAVSGALVSTVDSSSFNITQGTNLAMGSVGVDAMGAATNVTFTYSVQGAATVTPFEIRIGLDKGPVPNGTPDVSLATIAPGAADIGLTPGTYSVTRDVRSTLNSNIENGDRILVQLDTTDVVVEAAGDNAMSSPSLNVDLRAVNLFYNPNATSATFTYIVSADANVPAHHLQFYLDTTLPFGTFNVGDLAVGAAQNADATPGLHQAVGNYAGNAPAGLQAIFAIIDSDVPDLVNESDEANNTSGTVNGAVTDLVAVGLSYDPVTHFADLSYLVNAPIPVTAYNLEFFLDDTAPFGSFNPGDASLGFVAGNTAPGAYVESHDFTPNPPGTGQKVFAVLDIGAALAESDEGNNTAEATNSAITDIVAVSLAFDSVTNNAALSYTVVTPVPLAPYDIEFYLDDSAPIGILDPGDTLIGTVAGQINAGAFVANQSYLGNPPASGQTLFAFADANLAIAEDSEGNNQRSTTNSAGTDLVANALSYDATPGSQKATLSYNVDSPVAVGAYNIEFFLDRNLDGFYVFTDDQPAVATVAGDTTIGGPKLINGDFSGDPAASDQKVFAVIDRADTVDESNDEADMPTNNRAEATNTNQTDVAINTVAIQISGAATNVVVGYTVTSPIAVPAFGIQLSLDREGNGTIDAAIAAIPGGSINLNPGPHSTVDAPLLPFDIRAALDALTVQNGDKIVATITTPPPADVNAANNVGSSDGIEVDLEVTGVAVIGTNGFKAKATYRVTAPANVPAFTVRLGLDTLAAGNSGADGVISHYLLNGVSFIEFAGDVTPGIHTTANSINLADPIINSTKPIIPGQPIEILAEVDPDNLVRESSEDTDGIYEPSEQDSNTFGGSDIYAVNLALAAIDPNSHFGGFSLGHAFNLEFTYRVDSNPIPPGTNFTVAIWASTAAGGIDPARAPRPDVRVAQTTISANLPALDKQVGSHTITINNIIVPSASFDNGDLFLKVQVDDGFQVLENTDPDIAHNDVDNLLAVRNAGPDADVDNDGLTASQEGDGAAILAGKIFDATTLPDAAGAEVPADLTTTSDREPDNDRDGLGDKLERDTNTNADNPDTDADGLKDGEEDANRNGIFEPALGETDPRNWDSDGDGLSDFEEVKGAFKVMRYPESAAGYSKGVFSGRFDRRFATVVKTDPNKWDTDDDGISDWDELNTFAREAFRPKDLNNPTAEELNLLGSVAAIGLGQLRARVGLTFSADGQSGRGDFVPKFPGQKTKLIFGIRTDPSKGDTDDDGLMDFEDPAPQINPLRFGFDQDGDGDFDSADIEAIRKRLVSSGELGSGDAFDNAIFQARLLNFDQDRDGFLEAPDANGDGFPDFTRFNEATIEQAYAVDFSNDGDLNDGYDVGGLDLGEVDQTTESRFGTYRAGNGVGTPGGDGVLDTADSNGNLMASDNCPRSSNADQADFDGDGLGDRCDADLDNDGVPNFLDPFAQLPVTALNFPSICGFGMVEATFGALAGLLGLTWLSRRRFNGRRRR